MASAYVEALPPCEVCGGPVSRRTKYGICWQTQDCRLELKRRSRREHGEPARVRQKSPKAAQYQANWRARDPLARTFERARRRAAEKGIPFSLKRSDIPPVPERCPILGIKLEQARKKASPNSPALDRIRPERGYIPGNVQWLSHRANIMKNDAGPEELIAFARWALANYGERGDREAGTTAAWLPG